MCGPEDDMETAFVVVYASDDAPDDVGQSPLTGARPDDTESEVASRVLRIHLPLGRRGRHVFVHEVLPRDQVLDRAWELARRIAKRPSTVVRNTRHILMQDLRRSFANDLRHHALAGLWSTRQFFMGVAGGRNAFMEEMEAVMAAERLIDVIDPTIFDEEQRPPS